MLNIASPIGPVHVFEKTLSEADVDYRLALPSEELGHIILNPYSHNREEPIEFKIIDGDGNPYLLRLKLRRVGYLKPEITGDWLRFVREKGIKKGDRVVFMKHPVGCSDGVVFTVLVRKVVMVFGAVLGYAQLA